MKALYCLLHSTFTIVGCLWVYEQVRDPLQGSLPAELEVTKESGTSSEEQSNAEPVLASPTVSCLHEADGAPEDAPEQFCESPVLEVCSTLCMRLVAARNRLPYDSAFLLLSMSGRLLLCTF